MRNIYVSDEMTSRGEEKGRRAAPVPNKLGQGQKKSVTLTLIFILLEASSQ
jgi:hypothetical protein